MLSKEEKLRYGEILRKQMREKEEAKRMENLAKRGGMHKSATDTNVFDHHGSNFPQSPTPLNKTPVLTQKEILQRNLEEQTYNPYGKPGGGAPVNVDNYRRNISQPMGLQMSAEETYFHAEQREQREPKQYLEQPPPRSYIPGPYDPTGHSHDQMNHSSLAVSRPTYDPNYPQPQTFPQQFSQQPQYSNGLHPNMYIQPYPPNRMPSQEYIPQVIGSKQSLPQHEVNSSAFNYSRPQQSRMPTMPAIADQMQERPKNLRGLLRAQNQTMEEQLMRQKQKQEMQRHLQMQIKMAEEKRREQKERVKQEQMEEQRKNAEYLARQKQKIIDEERKKNEQKQKIIEENLRNLQKRKQLEEQAKLKIEHERRMKEDHQRNEQRRLAEERQEIARVELPSRGSTKRRHQIKQSQQEVFSSEIATESEEDLYREHQKSRQKRVRSPLEPKETTKKLQKFTHEIKKMRDEIQSQGIMFQEEIEKIKWEAQRAKYQKQRAQKEILELRRQILSNDREEDNRLFEAIRRQQTKKSQPHTSNSPHNQHNQHENYDEQPHSYPSQPAPRKAKPQYFSPVYAVKHEPERFQYTASMNSDPDMASLAGESTKIPVNLLINNKLTMSKLGNLVQLGGYEKPHKQIKNYTPAEVILEQKRKNHHRADELDRLIQKPTNQRAVYEESQVATVNTVQEIEELLKKKSHAVHKRGTSGTRLGQAGRQAVSREAIPYEGIGISSINSNADVEQINRRNERRLDQLRKLGVETVNSNVGEEEHHRLEALLVGYR